MTTTGINVKDVTERLREEAAIKKRCGPQGTYDAAMYEEAAEEIDMLRLMFQCVQDERDAARAEVQCLRGCGVNG